MTLRVLLFVVLFISFHACIQFDSKETILKKNTDPTPAWVNENGEINSEHPNYINIVFKKSDLYNLPLGVKQSQLIANKKISSLILSEIQKKLFQKLGKVTPNSKVIPLSTIHLISSQVVNQYLKDIQYNAPLADQIYWEFIKKQERDRASKEYYTVWVLLLIPKDIYDKAFLAIARELQNSNDQIAINLGNAILQQREKQ